MILRKNEEHARILQQIGKMSMNKNKSFNYYIQHSYYVN